MNVPVDRVISNSIKCFYLPSGKTVVLIIGVVVWSTGIVVLVGLSSGTTVVDVFDEIVELFGKELTGELISTVVVTEVTVLVISSSLSIVTVDNNSVVFWEFVNRWNTVKNTRKTIN